MQNGPVVAAGWLLDLALYYLMGLYTELCRLLRGGLLKSGQLFGEGGVGDHRGLRLTLEHALGLVQGFVNSN